MLDELFFYIISRDNPPILSYITDSINIDYYG